MLQLTALEHKFHRPETGLVLDNDNRIDGYASLFDKRDTGGDTVMPGAYTAALSRLQATGGRVRMLWQHDPTQPIGVWDEVVEDARGLRVSGRLLPEVTRAREAAALVASGAMDGLSIGYRTVRAERDPAGGRRLIELDLWEVSLVTFPMLPVARVAGKSDAESTAELHALAAVFRAARSAIARR